jgi:photosystem II stability/assembly factor-like uncharacterized protein
MGDIDIDPFDANHVVHVCGQGVWASEDLRNADKGQPVHFRFRVDGLEQAVVQKLVSPPAGAPLISGVADICGFRHDDLSKPAQHGMHSNPICNTTSGLDYAAHKPELLVRVGTAWGADKHGAFSRDGGVSWAPFASEPAGAESGGLIAMSADGATLWWSHKRGAAVFSKDYGKSWSKVSGLPDPVEAPPEAPLSLQLASDRVNPLKVYAFDAGRGQLYTSGDAGEHFEPARADLPELADWARPSCSIQAMPGVEGDVWVSTGKALLRSTDSGKTFEPLANAEEGHAVGFGKAAPGRLNPSVFLVGKVAGAAGIFRSDDLGKTFVRINDDQHQFGFVQQIIGDPRRFGRVYLGTAGRGVLVGDPH